MKNKSSIKFYNMFFPIWLLWLFPFAWSVVLPVNFIIDSLVLLLTLKVLKINNKKKIYKKTILKVWGFGFLSDFIGTLVMFSICVVADNLPNNIRRLWFDNLTIPLGHNPFTSIYSLTWAIVSIIVTSFFIYLFNYKISFRKLDIEEKSKKKLALSLAIFTAPYLFLLPTTWFL